jgi:hypothetical protein
LNEEQAIPLEIDASEELTVAEVAEKAKAQGTPFAVVAERGSTVGVLVVDELTRSSAKAVEVARETPAIVERTVPVDLPGGETVQVDVQLQGADLAIWKRGSERLVMALGGRNVEAALSSHVMALASFSDTELPGRKKPLPPRHHTYVCAKKHYEQRASDDRDRKCKKCGRRLYRI